VPALSRIRCTTLPERAQATTTKKKRAREEKIPASSLIDLSGDTTDDDGGVDVALDRRVQKKERATSRRNVPFLPENVARSCSALNGEEEDDEDPTTVNHTHWIWKRANNEVPLGKWLVFASEATVCSVWRAIWPPVVSGALGACGVKMATKLNATIRGGSSYVICVYATSAKMKHVGLQLIPIVQRNISFKKDAATAANMYSYNTAEQVTSLTLCWNRGRPSFTKPRPIMAVAKSRRTAVSTSKEVVTELTHSFEIVLTCVGMDKSAVSLETRQSFLAGTSSFTLRREPDNHFDPDNAIAVLMLDEPSSQKVGYILSTTKAGPPQAKLLAPWMDRNLLRIVSVVMLRRVGASTMNMLVKGMACPGARELLDSL
jgi:hypothetical protein